MSTPIDEIATVRRMNRRDAGPARRAGSQVPRYLIGEISASGIKGRARPLPRGRKWNLWRGLPGRASTSVQRRRGRARTFKDRAILSATPTSSSRHDIGGSPSRREGIVYLRAEYAYLRPELEAVLARRRTLACSQGHPGKQGFDFDNVSRWGPGHVCGEETALIESLDGPSREPRNRPPFPVDTGSSTVRRSVNNVETLAWVAASSEGAPGSRAPTRQVDRTEDPQRVGDCEVTASTSCPRSRSRSSWRRSADRGQGGPGSAALPGQCRAGGRLRRTIAYETSDRRPRSSVFGPHRTFAVAENFSSFFVEESGPVTPCRHRQPSSCSEGRDAAAGLLPHAVLNDVRSGRDDEGGRKCGSASPAQRLPVHREALKDEIMGRSGPRTDSAGRVSQGAG